MTATTTLSAQTGAQPAPAAKLRRRPAYAMLGAALIAAGALTAAWFAQATDTATTVVVARDTIYRGQVIQEADLTTAALSGLAPDAVIPAADAANIVGLTAAVDVPANLPVPPSAVTDTPTPGAGSSVIGLRLTDGQLPAGGLVPGDDVRIVTTPSIGEPVTSEPATARAVVVSTAATEGADAMRVDLLVDADDAPGLAVLAAAGRAALVLDAPQGGR